MQILAIDPGQKGAIATYDTIRNEMKSTKLPYEKNYQGKPELVSRQAMGLITTFEPHVIVIEQVNAMPGQGVSSSFKFGQNFGEILSLVKLYAEALGGNVRVERIRPAKWKSKLGLTKKPKSDAKALVVSKYPDMRKISVDEADACCLALYYELIKRD